MIYLTHNLACWLFIRSQITTDLQVVYLSIVAGYSSLDYIQSPVAFVHMPWKILENRMKSSTPNKFSHVYGRVCEIQVLGQVLLVNTRNGCSYWIRLKWCLCTLYLICLFSLSVRKYMYKTWEYILSLYSVPCPNVQVCSSPFCDTVKAPCSLKLCCTILINKQVSKRGQVTVKLSKDGYYWITQFS